MPVTVSLHKTFNFVQQAAGLAQIFDTFSLFPEVPNLPQKNLQVAPPPLDHPYENSRKVEYAPETLRAHTIVNFRKVNAIIYVDAQMAKLVDAPASGAGGCKTVEVRVFFWAPLSR